MLGIVFIAPGRAILREELAPEAGSGQIVCRTLYSGVSNGTERSCLVGGNYGGRWPARVAYQHVACVERVGPDVSGFSPGDLVFAGSLGGHVERFAEQIRANDDDDNLLMHLPAGVHLTEAALLGIAAVSVHNTVIASVQAGQRVLVIGAGPIGQIIAQLANAAGAEITLCDINHKRLQTAHECGIASTADDLAHMGEFPPFEVVFETSGADVLDQIVGVTWSGGFLQPAGRLVLTGGRNRVNYHFNAAQGKELQIVHVNHFHRSDLEMALQFLLRGTLRLGPLIYDVLSIDKAPAFYDRLRDDPGSTLGTVFKWPTVNTALSAPDVPFEAR